MSTTNKMVLSAMTGVAVLGAAGVMANADEVATQTTLQAEGSIELAKPNDPQPKDTEAWTDAEIKANEKQDATPGTRGPQDKIPDDTEGLTEEEIKAQDAKEKQNSQPDKMEVSADEGNTSIVAPETTPETQAAQATYLTGETLPETGSEQGTVISVLGAMLMSFAGFVGVKSFKNN